MREKYFCLDFLRAFAILLVYFLHYTTMSKTDISWFPEVIRFGWVGVDLFFVLSGFLITNILIQEQEIKGSISYKNFFIKRVFRIFPAYYFYFALMILFISFTKIFMFSSQDIFAGIFYLSNYLSDLNPWPLGHFWSLAVEEQFYLFWPLLFLLFHKKLGDKLPLLIITLSPLIRILTYFLFPELRSRVSIMTHTRFDSLLFGCYLAYQYKKNNFKAFNQFILKFKLHFFAGIHILFFSRLLQIQFKGKYIMTFGYSLDALMMCLILIYVIENKNAFTEFLNTSFLVHIGTLSYSLYLWHMPFAWSGFGNDFLFLRILGIYACALTSFLIIETPFMNWRQKVFDRKCII